MTWAIELRGSERVAHRATFTFSKRTPFGMEYFANTACGLINLPTEQIHQGGGSLDAIRKRWGLVASECEFCCPKFTKPDFTPVDFDSRKDPEKDPEAIARLATGRPIFIDTSKRTWKTREGHVVRVVEMTDMHVLNAYDLVQRTFSADHESALMLRAEAQRRVCERDGRQSPWEKLQTIQPLLSGFIPEETAAEAIKAAFKAVKPPPKPVDEHAARFAQLDFDDEETKPKT